METWERRILRQIFGAIKGKEIWGKPTNNVLMEVFGHQKTTVTVTIQRLRWLEHILETAKDNFGRLDVGRWRKLAQDRENGRNLLRSLGPLGLLC